MTEERCRGRGHNNASLFRDYFEGEGGGFITFSESLSEKSEINPGTLLNIFFAPGKHA
jgi:hypothetical protein